jgi:hypothetical protein
MPVPPENWREATACQESEDALRYCYDLISAWGSSLQTWLETNLPDHSVAGSLPSPPIFVYSVAEDIQRDLTRRVRDAFALAQHTVAHPTASLDVAIGFHRPLTPSEVRAAIPEHATLQEQSALKGKFEPRGADWGGSVRVSTPTSIDASIDDFYRQQAAIAEGNIQELEGEQAEDPEDAEDIDAALGDLRRFKARLDARGAFVTGVTVRLGPRRAASAMRSSTPPGAAAEVKTITPVPAESADTEGANSLAGMSVDAAEVTDPASTSSRTLTARGEPTCVDRGEAGLFSNHYLSPNPLYFAPSRHKADTEFTAADGDHHLKEHRLRFRWRKDHSLYWVCADLAGQRNIEVEAMVYPDPDYRWSTNWETNNAYKYTSDNLPGDVLHQDDIASGDYPFQLPPGNPYDKAKYPDFSIVAQASQEYRYRKYYWVNFTTNEGETDAGRVIYSVQATHEPKTGGDDLYCFTKANDYKSCMFSSVEACYNHAWISQPPVYRKVDWLAHLGFEQSMKWVLRDRRYRHQIQDGRQVRTFCDPRPAGSSD